jgi:hypothetical protein
MKISVTEKHIEDGNQKDGCDCAVSLALKEVIDPKIGEPFSSPMVIHLISSEVGISFVQTPPEVSRFIQRFDQDKRLVSPFDFNLDIPSDYLKPEYRELGSCPTS